MIDKLCGKHKPLTFQRGATQTIKTKQTIQTLLRHILKK
jgi:hypothetical protein